MIAEILDKFKADIENTAQKDEERNKDVIETTWIGDVPVDLLEDVSPKRKWTVTINRVEAGATIADHRSKDPDTLTLKVKIFDDEDGNQEWWAKVKKLDDLAAVHQLVEVVTPFGFWPSMMITAVSPEHGFALKNGVTYVVELIEVILTNASLSLLDKSLIPKAREDKKKKPNPPTPVDNEDSTKGAEQEPAGPVQPEPPPESWILEGLGIPSIF